MALTATATKSTRTAVCRILGMKNPAVVIMTPNKVNIKYRVISKPITIEEAFGPLVEDVHANRLNTDRTIIYCRTYNNCSKIYLYITSRLGEEKTEPVGMLD